jgi:hypothetical protein
MSLDQNATATALPVHGTERPGGHGDPHAEIVRAHAEGRTPVTEPPVASATTYTEQDLGWQAWRVGVAAAVQAVTAAALADLRDPGLEIEHFYEWYEQLLGDFLVGDPGATRGLLYALARIVRAAATPLGYDQPAAASDDVRAATRTRIADLRRRLPDGPSRLVDLAAQDDDQLVAEVDREWSDGSHSKAHLALALYTAAVAVTRDALKVLPSGLPQRMALLAQLTESLMRNPTAPPFARVQIITGP